MRLILSSWLVVAACSSDLLYPHIYNPSGIYVAPAAFTAEPAGSATQVTRTVRQQVGTGPDFVFVYQLFFTSTVTVTDVIVQIEETSPKARAASYFEVPVTPADVQAGYIIFNLDAFDSAPDLSVCDGGQRCWGDPVDPGALVDVDTSLDDSSGSSTAVHSDHLVFGASGGSSGGSCPSYQDLGAFCPGGNVCIPDGCTCPSPSMQTGTGSPCSRPGQTVICGC